MQVVSKVLFSSLQRTQRGMGKKSHLFNTIGSPLAGAGAEADAGIVVTTVGNFFAGAGFGLAVDLVGTWTTTNCFLPLAP